MPIDFPASPTLNQIYNYTGSSDVRFNKSFIYNGVEWEEINIPIGAMQSFAGISSPAGWLLCDGTAYNRTTYAALFNVITISTTGNTTISNATITNIPSTTNMGIGMPISGTNIQSGTKISLINSSTSITMDKTATASGTGINFVVAPYGVGNGSTTFNVPDLRAKSAIGGGTDGTLTDRVLGVSGGKENISLSVNEIKSHAHSINGNSHNHGFNAPNYRTGLQSNDHYHPPKIRKITSEWGDFVLVANALYQNRVLVDGLIWDFPYPSQLNNNAHNHTFTTNTGYASITVDSTGNDPVTAHENMQPFIATNYIIKY